MIFSRLRQLCFAFAYYGSVCWFGLTGALLFWLPYHYRSRYITLWNRFVVCAARKLLKISVRLEGAENIPDRACVIMSKHQSAWETFYLQTVFSPLCTILKRELLRIPFFGWALWALEPIAIDRGSPKQALRQLQTLGLKRLAQGRSVLIFPEGTRLAPGQRGRYARGGADLALAAGAPIVPVAHNAGAFWSSDGKTRRPGEMVFIVGEAIEPAEKSARQLTAEVEHWVETESMQLLPQR